MACTRTYATLRICSKNVHPDEITEKLGMVPSSTRPIDPESKYEHQRNFHLWAYTTKDISDSTENVEHLEIILSTLKGKSNQIGSLRSIGCDADIFCYWDSTGQGGPSISVELMKELVEFGLGVSWDIYFNDEESA